MSRSLPLVRGTTPLAAVVPATTAMVLFALAWPNANDAFAFVAPPGEALVFTAPSDLRWHQGLVSAALVVAPLCAWGVAALRGARRGAPVGAGETAGVVARVSAAAVGALVANLLLVRALWASALSAPAGVGSAVALAVRDWRRARR